MRERTTAVLLLGTTALVAGCTSGSESAAKTDQAESSKTISAGAASFAEPFQVLADGRAITVDTGHAAPAYADMDGDSIPDLIVGQFEGGKARIYHNYGTADKQEFRDFEWFQAGGQTASVDYG
jgi:hypothetical protein